ncbi:MAG: adenosine deaminase [Planctomycetes bacterium]|nr:adenosine deaminase [Planctomycetota bacterium]
MENKEMTQKWISELPKVQLHDHLDGGLRPSTIIELADERGIELPSNDPDQLGSWFFRGADQGSLPKYLEGFSVTTSVMQDEEALHRVAREHVEGLAADGVIYGEVRFAPVLHVEKGLDSAAVLEAVLDGIAVGCQSTGIDVRIIVCSLRHMDPQISLRSAEVAVQFRDRGVVGFDLAGDESGHPPADHNEAFHFLRRSNFNITIHAGEAFGLSSIWQAIQHCGAHRIGHATRLVEDDTVPGDHRGTLGEYILDHRIPLEMCLSSNLHTGAVSSLVDHPFPRYLREGYRVGLNVDNTLMSATTLSKEWQLAVDLFGLGLTDLERIAVNSMKSAFCEHSTRRKVIQEQLLPRFRAVQDATS